MSTRKHPVEKRNFTIAEFVISYAISRSQVYTEIREERLKPFKVGRKTLISKEAAEAWQKTMVTGNF